MKYVCHATTLAQDKDTKTAGLQETHQNSRKSQLFLGIMSEFFFVFCLLFAVLKFEQSVGNANICLGQLANILTIRGRVGPHLFYWSKRVSGQPLLYSIFFCCYYGEGGDTVVKTQDKKLWQDQFPARACGEHNRHV